jgi:mono/diheme cytochrome c family protein
MMRALLILVVFALALPAMAADELPPASSKLIDFARDVQPIFAKNCYSCHGEKRQKAGLRLDQRPEAMLPKIITSGKSADSRLIQLVAGTDPNLQMPPAGPPLSREQVGILRAWVDQGAKWPSSEATHWSLRALVTPPVPGTAGQRANPIDAFVLAKLTEKGLTPSPPTDRRTLIRRLTFDLHGLPPTPSEIEAFVNDRSPGAYERLVDRLLASPRYGERWARHWMDIAHFAETHGHD